MRRGARSPRGRVGPGPPECLQDKCFDHLVRACVACGLLPPGSRPASPPFRLLPGRPAPSGAPCPPLLSPAPAACTGSPEPAPALLESSGSGPGAALPLPALLFGAPAGLGLALALVLLCLVTWLRTRRGPVPPEARDAEPEEPLDSVTTLSPGVPEVSAPAWPPPTEDPAATPTVHSVPVPATELGSTELVTTKTTGPEQQ